MTCSNNYFTDVSVGCQGRISDGGLQANTTLKKKAELLIVQPRNYLNKVKFMTDINLRNISAMGCHLQEVFQIKMHKPNTLIKVLHYPNWSY
jgi:hypothetical protein